MFSTLAQIIVCVTLAAGIVATHSFSYYRDVLPCVI